MSASEVRVSNFVEPLRLGFGPVGLDRAGGSLGAVRLAVKDVIDVQGVATGAGNPAFLEQARPAAEHAVAVGRLMRAGALVVGKAHTDELAFSLSGTNVHYGTPRNPAAPGRVPGGSSSGSAAAVAGGLAQIALGTDTAGSIRVPASYCGVHGLRPSHGRAPMSGVLALAPTFDTVGVLAATGELLERAGLCLLDASPGDPPDALVLASDLLDEADPAVAASVRIAADRLARRLQVPLLEVAVTDGRLASWLEAFRGRQLVEAWAVHGEWLQTRRPPLGPGVGARFAAARQTPAAAAQAATAVAGEVLMALDRVLSPGAALVLPSTATVAPRPAAPAGEKEDLRRRTMRLTCVAGLAGAPAVSLPVASVDAVPVGLSLLARPGEDERLLAAARVTGSEGG